MKFAQIFVSPSNTEIFIDEEVITVTPTQMLIEISIEPHGEDDVHFVSVEDLITLYRRHGVES